MQGIYKITNTENGQVYIGRSTDIENRWKQHQEALEKGVHHYLVCMKLSAYYKSKGHEVRVVKTKFIKEKTK